MNKTLTILFALAIFTILFAQERKQVVENSVYLPDGVPGTEIISDSPRAPEEILNDDFESYADFSLTFSPWILIDGDGLGTYGFETITFPNEGVAMAGIIFNPTQTTPATTGADAHSGSKYVAFFASVPAGGQVNNDWMITPTLNLGINSSVSFWAKSYTDQYGLERFNVGVSTTGTNQGDFTIISPSPYVQAPTDWTEFTYDLSAYDGQNIHIAINCVSSDAFILFVDDFVVTTDYNVPVELTSFTAVQKGSAVELNWSTATETNNKGFEIERSVITSGTESTWKTVGYVDGKGTTTETVSYSFSDNLNGVDAEAVEYRLKQIDYDGAYEYSDVVAVENIVPTEYSVSQNYPNPFNPSTKITFALPTESNVTLSVYNALGQEVSKVVNGTLNAGTHVYTFNASEFTSGIYFYSFDAQGIDGTTYNMIRKMMLVK